MPFGTSLFGTASHEIHVPTKLHSRTLHPYPQAFEWTAGRTLVSRRSRTESMAAHGSRSRHASKHTRLKSEAEVHKAQSLSLMMRRISSPSEPPKPLPV